ncbi:hypothetical protein P152DRAFT_386398, partial [Eremomyces bilateralis CBS 781.70]
QISVLVPSPFLHMSQRILTATEQILIWIMWGASFTLTLARGITRWQRHKKFGADDYCAFIALLCLTGLTAVITRMMPQFYLAGEFLTKLLNNPADAAGVDMGQMMADTSTSLKLMFRQVAAISQPQAKLSLLFFFRRLIIGLPQYLRVWWAIFTIVVLLYIGCLLSNLLACRPLSKYWTGFGCSDPDELRASDQSIRFATGADIATDGLIMVLPLRLLRSLSINARQKMGLGLMFSIGFIIIAFAIARLIMVTQATSDASGNMAAVANSPSLLSTWSHVEAAVAVIVSNLPAFRFLLSQ